VFVKNDTFETSIKGVFAGGDAVTGPGTVIESIAHGKHAACMIDKYLKKEKIERTYALTRPSVYVDPVTLTDAEIAQGAYRVKVPMLPSKARKKNLKEVDLCYSESAAVKEARRCLRCELETKDAKEKIKENRKATEKH